MMEHLQAWFSVPWFTLGDTQVTAGRLIGLVVIVVAVWWFASLVETGVRRIALRGDGHALSKAAVYAWSRVLRYSVWIVGTLVGLGYIGFDLTNIFSNFMSGIIILLERTLKVGDFVDLQSGVQGTVREIGLRYTRVTTNDDVDVIVPNSEFINGRVTNWTYESQMRRLHIPFGVAYGSDKRRVKAAALRAAVTVNGSEGEPGREAGVWLVGFGDSSLNFELVVWVGPERVARPAFTQAEFLWAIEDELRVEGIEIPFPQRDLHVRSGTLQVRLDGAPPR